MRGESCRGVASERETERREGMGGNFYPTQAAARAKLRTCPSQRVSGG